MNTTGYLNNSPHRFNPMNVIPGGSITMQGVNIPLLLRPNKGKSKIVMPNSGEYNFPKADFVTEIPLQNYQFGGLNDCPEGFQWSVADQQCLPVNQAVASNFRGNSNKFITGTINPQGQKIGGTGATEYANHTSQNSNNISNNETESMKLKRIFGTPNIPAILATNLLGFGLSSFANNVEQGRQAAFAQSQMNNSTFNGSYSNAQNDYGVDPYEQTGQLRPTYQKGGQFNPIDYLYDDEDTVDIPKKDTIEKTKKKRITEEDIDNNDELANEVLDMDTAVRNRKSNYSFNPENSNYALMYLKHQQGAAGVEAIQKAAEQGLDAVPRNWNKENIQANMQRNVGKDFKGKVTPQSFINYWSSKFNNHMQIAANKQTPYDSIFQKVGQEEGIDPLFLKAVANLESGLNPNNNTPSKYKGLFAMNSKTFKGNIFDPYQNAKAAAKNLKQYEQGGEFSVDFDTMTQLQAKGIKFKIIE